MSSAMLSQHVEKRQPGEASWVQGMAARSLVGSHGQTFAGFSSAVEAVARAVSEIYSRFL